MKRLGVIDIGTQSILYLMVDIEPQYTLSTVEQNYSGLSSRSIECLIKQCQGDFDNWEERIVLPVKLIKRESCISNT